jgi:hypothetical protein
MMRACADVTRSHGIKTIVSVNPIMVDGTGMCGGCRVKVGDQIRFACVDGPDFDGHLVDFDDLTGRLKRYAEAEKKAMERWSERCRMGGQGDPGARGWKSLRPSVRNPAIEELVPPDPFEDVQGG